MNALVTTLLFSLWALNADTDTVIDYALKAEAAGNHEAAAVAYQWAGARDAQLSRFLRYRALRAVLQTNSPAPERVAALARGAETWGYAGTALAAVRADAKRSGGLPGTALLRAALDTNDRADICGVLGEALEPDDVKPPAELVDLQHAECSDTEILSVSSRFQHEPTPDARLRRAERLYGQVRFTAAAEELSAIGALGSLPEATRCRVLFRTGRTMYRLRKRRSESEPAFKTVASSCMGEGERDLRRRSLYAIGKRRFEKKDHAAAKTAFQTLLSDFSDTSHADDAVFYLARVARAQGDRSRELELLQLAAEKYPSGDMFAEIVWEVLETHYRKGAWQKFVDAVDAVKRPDHDGNYYSQGRLEYFTAQALIQLNEKDLAKQRWASAWEKYPWSFYGYLSRVRLAKAGGVPAEPNAPQSTPTWLDTPAWRVGALGRIFRHDPALAASYAGAFEADSDEQRWQLAYVYDAAGRYEVSHNIVRRSIGGRPWVDPEGSRLAQWRLAWPDPFGVLVEAAVKAETEQAKKPLLDAGLPRAIMREESSFIETIESYAGALGLMQLMPRTALGHDDDIEGDATRDRLKTAEINVRVGVDHLFWLAKRFDGHPALIVAAYNAGAGAVGRWLKRYPNQDIALFIEDIPALQTRDYTKRVIGSYAAYQWLTGRSKLDDRVIGSPK